MMGERDSVIAKLFTKKSYHGNLSVIYIVQNLFHQSKDHRTISLNASYLVLTKNVRDASQVIHLALVSKADLPQQCQILPASISNGYSGTIFIFIY